jgi:hypothetical protein
MEENGVTCSEAEGKIRRDAMTLIARIPILRTVWHPHCQRKEHQANSKTSHLRYTNARTYLPLESPTGFIIQKFRRFFSSQVASASMKAATNCVYSCGS